GAILGQKDGKNFHPIYFANKTLNAAQQNYTIIEKELMAVVFAFDKFRSYLVLFKTIVHTDHSALSVGYYSYKNLISKLKIEKVFSTWMPFGGNTRDLGSFGEETDKTMDLHQISLRIMHTGRGDGVASIKRRRRYLSNDGVRKLTTASGRNQLKLDLEDSIL
ncbi:reverse transcriptase domain-containing protein, partial [Tanacetum coccineum]